MSDLSVQALKETIGRIHNAVAASKPSQRQPTKVVFIRQPGQTDEEFTQMMEQGKRLLFETPVREGGVG